MLVNLICIQQSPNVESFCKSFYNFFLNIIIVILFRKVPDALCLGCSIWKFCSLLNSNDIILSIYACATWSISSILHLSFFLWEWYTSELISNLSTLKLIPQNSRTVYVRMLYTFNDKKNQHNSPDTFSITRTLYRIQ